MFGLPKFYAYVAIGLALAGLFTAYKVDRYRYGQAEYKRGVSETEEAQAKIVDLARIENEKRVSAVKLESVRIQTELEGKQRETELMANTLRDRLSFSRVCLDEVRRDRMPETTPSAGPIPTAPDSAGPAETIGSALVTLVQACQNQTDALVAGQKYIGVLQAQGFYESSGQR